MMGPWVEASCLGPLRATHPTEVVMVSILVTPTTSSFMMQLALMDAMVGANIAAILKGSWGTSWTFSGGESLCRQAATPMKPGGSITHQTISSSFGGDGGSDLVICGVNSFGCCHPTILSLELWPWSLCLGPCKMGGRCLAATTDLEGCSTSFHPENWFGRFSF